MPIGRQRLGPFVWLHGLGACRVAQHGISSRLKQAYSVARSLRNGSGRHCIPAPLLHTGLLLHKALSAQMAWTVARASPPYSYSRVPHVLTMLLQCACYKQRTNHL